MKNKWVARIAFVCVIGFLIYWGYGYWNSYLDEQETLVGAEWVVPLSEDATAFECGVAAVRDEKGWCLINENEQVISRISRCKYMSGFSEGIAAAEFNKEIKYYDREGKVMFSIEKGFNQEVRSAMYKFKEGKVTFRGKNGKLGYMDTKDNVIVKSIFTDADIVENGEAFVELGRRSGVIKF